MRTSAPEIWRPPLPKESDQAEEVLHLRRTLRDMVALSALPSIWVDSDIKSSLQNVTDVLQAALRAFLVCVRMKLPDGSHFETGSARKLGKAAPLSQRAIELLDKMTGQETSAVAIEEFDGAGPLTALSYPVYYDGRQFGFFVALYRPNVAPQEHDRLILQVAANQITLLLQRHKDQEERFARKLAEERLRQTEHHYQQLVQSLPAAIYTCDKNGRIVLYNEAAALLWGRRPVVGEERWCGSWKIFNTDGTPVALENCPMGIACRDGLPIRGQEIIVERPDGSRSFVLPHPNPIRDESGEIIGTVNMLVDIGGLKRAEQALRASEARMHSLLTLMPAAVYACDEEGRITFYNRRAAELWGREPKLNDDGQKFCAAYRCWFGDKVLLPEETPMQIAVSEGKSFRNLEPIFERPDGTCVPVLVNIDPLFDPNGGRMGAINVFQDVTQLKHAEEQLRGREHHLRAIIDNTPDCVKVVAPDGTVLDMNGAGLSAVEADGADQVIGQNIFQIIAPEFRDAFRTLNDRVCAGNKERLQFEIIGLKGSRRWMETCAVPLRDTQHGLVHLAVTRDITERKETEKSLRKRGERVQLLSETLGQLLGATNPETVVRELFPKVAGHLGVDTYFNFLVSADGEYLELHSCAGIPEETAQQIRRLHFGQAICGTVAQTRQAIHAANIQESNYDKAALVRGFGIQCYACNPLMVGERLLGTLSFASRTRTRFDEDELQFLRIISQYTAVALDRLRAAETLRESEERFRAVLDNSATIIYVKDCDGKYLLTNKCYQGALQLDENAFVGKTDFDLFPSVIASQFRDNDLKVIRENEALEFEESVRVGDQDLTFISAKFPLRKADGAIYAVAGVSTDITERKRAEALLLEQKELLELIANDAPLLEVMESLIGVIQKQSHGLIGSVLLMDPEGVHLYPFAGKQIPQEWCKLITPLPIGPCVGSCGTAAYRKEKVIVRDISTDPLWANYKDAAERFGFRACWSTPIRSSDGKVLGTFAGYYLERRQPTDREWEVVEILSRTAGLAIERKQALEAQRKLSALIEHSPNFIGVADLERRPLFLNPAGLALVGLEPEEVTQTQLLDYFPEEEQRRVERDIIPVLLQRRHWDGEVLFRHFKTEALIPVMWNVFVIPDAKTNAPAFLACVSTDITERKQVEDALRRSETLFRELTNFLPQMVWAARPDGFIDYYNKRWYEFTGLPETYGEENWRLILHPDDASSCLDTYHRCIGAERPFQGEYRFRDGAKNEYRWFLVRALPIRDEAGKVIRWFGTCTDIDDQKREEEKLETIVAERTARLRDTVAELEAFSYSIAHDMRAPLRAMNSYARFLEADFSDTLPEQGKHYARRIATGAERLDSLIKDVLNYSKISRSEMLLAAVNVEKLIHDIIETYPDLRDSGAEILIQAPIPGVIGNGAALTQCISNLLSNAVKFVRPGTTSQVRIRSEKQGEMLRIWVEDNGIGISEEGQKRIFHMFQRLNPARDFDGTGIGLTIVRKAVERMGGRVGVVSQPNVGSCFWFELKQAT